MTLLLIFGLVFPTVSLLSSIAAWVQSRRTNGHSSPVLIPFIGPIALTTWVCVTSKPWWLILLAWCCDLGTIAFLSVSPRLIREWWQTSSFTRVCQFEGAEQNRSVALTLHSTGRYFLRTQWHRPPGETGILGSGEVGSYSRSDGKVLLKSDRGHLRELVAQSETRYRVVDSDAEAESASLNGWVPSREA
jgi:hypothetical protein